MLKMKDSGLSLRKIAKVFKISFQRVDQIVNKRLGGREFTREAVRVRDKHTCQQCGKKWKHGSRKFDIHHLNGLCGKLSTAYDRIGSMNNLITFCHKCHLNLDEVRKKMSIPKAKQDER